MNRSLSRCKCGRTRDQDLIPISREERYLRGEGLRGEEMGEREIDEWFRNETEAYARLGSHDRSRYRHNYHGLNWWHGYRLLSKTFYRNVLGVGSAYGDEFLPVTKKIGALTIIEPSTTLRSEYIGPLRPTYVSPHPGGRFALEDHQFDLVTCFNVLHHIPRVSRCLGEIRRCVTDDGEVLLREPIVSLGDWRFERAGLTPNERGIPLAVFRAMIADAGFTIRHEAVAEFRPLASVMRLGLRPYNSRCVVLLDAVLSRMWLWNLRYHAVNGWQKVRPSAVAFVLTPNSFH